MPSSTLRSVASFQPVFSLYWGKILEPKGGEFCFYSSLMEVAPKEGFLLLKKGGGAFFLLFYKEPRPRRFTVSRIVAYGFDP